MKHFIIFIFHRFIFNTNKVVSSNPVFSLGIYKRICNFKNKSNEKHHFELSTLRCQSTGGVEDTKREKTKGSKGSRVDERDVISLVALGAHLRPFAWELKPAAESISPVRNDRLSQHCGSGPRRRNDGPVTSLSRRPTGNL